MRLEQDMLSLEYEGITEYCWVRQVPKGKEEEYDAALEGALEAFRCGGYKAAFKTLVSLSREFGIANFDCNHHLAILVDSDAKRIQLLEPILDAVEKELKRVKFKKGDKLSYSRYHNRPFYRSMHYLSMCYLKTSDKRQKGIELFQTLLNLNPDDNLGCRYHLVWEYIADGKYSPAKKIIDHFNRKGFIDPELLYAGALLHFSKKELAVGKTYLTKALSNSPLYGLLMFEFPEGLKKYFPIVEELSGITRGSLDEALELYTRTYQLWQPLLEVEADGGIRPALFDMIRSHFDKDRINKYEDDEEEDYDDEEDEDEDEDMEEDREQAER